MYCVFYALSCDGKSGVATKGDTGEAHEKQVLLYSQVLEREGTPCHTRPYGKHVGKANIC